MKILAIVVKPNGNSSFFDKWESNFSYVKNIQYNTYSSSMYFSSILINNVAM